MTEEHDPKAADSGQSATDPGDSQAAGAPISLDDSTVEALLAHPKVNEHLQSLAERTGQKVKDRRIAGLEKDVQEILDKLNLTPEQQAQYKEIQRDTLLEQLQQRVLDGGQQAVSDSEGQAKPTGGKAVDIVGSFQRAGYDINNLTMEDLQYAESFQGTDVELANDLLRRRLGLSKEDKPAAAGGVMPASGGRTAAASGSEAALRAEYEARLKKIQPGSVNEVTALKAEYRKKGLDVF